MDEKFEEFIMDFSIFTLTKFINLTESITCLLKNVFFYLTPTL